MSRVLERALHHAAEAAVGHLIVSTKLSTPQDVSEQALRITLARTIRDHVWCTTRPDYPVQVASMQPPEPTTSGEHHTLDVGIDYQNRTYLLSVVPAAHFRIRRNLDVTSELVTLVNAIPADAATPPTANRCYLMVLNLATYDTNPKRPGTIVWTASEVDAQVTCIGTYMYRSARMMKTAALFRIVRTM